MTKLTPTEIVDNAVAEWANERRPLRAIKVALDLAREQLGQQAAALNRAKGG